MPDLTDLYPIEETGACVPYSDRKAIERRLVAPAQDKNIEITVVVSGQPQRIRVNTHQTVEHLVHEALKQSDNKGQSSDQWELRTEEGALLDQNRRVAEAGIVAGVTLFLNPRAGAGG